MLASTLRTAVKAYVLGCAFKRWLRERWAYTHAFFVRYYASITGNGLLYLKYMKFPVALRLMIRESERERDKHWITCPRCNKPKGCDGREPDPMCETCEDEIWLACNPEDADG